MTPAIKYDYTTILNTVKETVSRSTCHDCQLKCKITIHISDNEKQTI